MSIRRHHVHINHEWGRYENIDGKTGVIRRHKAIGAPLELASCEKKELATAIFLYIKINL